VEIKDLSGGAISAPMAGREADAMTAPQITPMPIPESRGPLRLRLASILGQDRIDGAWWPYSRDFAQEMSDLVEHFPATRGRINRAVFSSPDWDTAPRKVAAGARVIKVGSFPEDDTHLLIVQLSDGRRLTLLVVPPDFTPGQGEEALLAASATGSRHAASHLLREVTAQQDAESIDRWAPARAVRPVAAHG
jgi:hypothetical protein